MNKPSALQLAFVAAVLDPALAKTNPLEAVRIASKLIAAAQKHIDRAARLNVSLATYQAQWRRTPSTGVKGRT